MTTPTRLTDMQVDEAIADAVEYFIDSLYHLTAECDWAGSGRITGIVRVETDLWQNINQLMACREPRD